MNFSKLLLLSFLVLGVTACSGGDDGLSADDNESIDIEAMEKAHEKEREKYKKISAENKLKRAEREAARAERRAKIAAERAAAAEKN